jgi:hypothetical protein
MVDAVLLQIAQIVESMDRARFVVSKEAQHFRMFVNRRGRTS